MSLLLDLVVAPGYPAAIQIPHDLWGISSFRASFSASEWSAVPWAHKLVGGYFSFCFGGTTLRDLFLGNAPSLIASPTVSKYWLGCWLLSCCSPWGNAVHGALQRRRGPVRVLTRMMEAMDSSTTLCSSFEVGARLHPEGALAPYVVAMVAALGGSIMRYLERKGRGLEGVKTEWGRPTGSFQRALGYTLVYGLLRRLYGTRTARVAVVFFHMATEVLAELMGQNLNPCATVLDAVAPPVAKVGTTVGT